MVYQKVHLILSFDSYHHSVLLFIGGSFVIILVSMLKVCLMFCGGNKKKIKKRYGATVALQRNVFKL